MPPSAAKHERRRDADARRRESRSCAPHGRREDEQHREALDDHDERGGHADLPLHRERAGLQQADEQRRRRDRQRLEGAEQRDRHRLEAEAERKALDQPMMDAENLDAAREAGERARRAASPPR